MSWEQIDEGWGRYAADFAYSIEAMHWREYLHLLDRTRVGPGTRYVDIACGGGLALRLAYERGAHVTGVDASRRLARIAIARTPDADIRVGDMFALPFDDASFDVATSFRGIWGNCLGALQEARRVVRPGGMVGLSFWGHQKKMQAYPLFAVLGQTTQEERDNTGALVSIALPGAAEQLMSTAGLQPQERTSVHLHWEFPDIDTTARALASTGPAHLAIRNLGEAVFMDRAREAAAGLYVEGVGVRAEVEVQCLVGMVPH